MKCVIEAVKYSRVPKGNTLTCIIAPDVKKEVLYMLMYGDKLSVVSALRSLTFDLRQFIWGHFQ